MTEQNKQPPAEDGAAIAVVDADAPCGIALTDAGAKLPIGTKLYTSKTTATQAAVAAAMSKCMEMVKGKVALYDGQMEGADYDDFIRNEWAADAMRQLLKDLNRLIPAEACAALGEYVQEKCMEVANEMNTIKSIVDDDSIYSIVTSVIEKGK
jgi:hypothetical protein